MDASSVIMRMNDETFFAGVAFSKGDAIILGGPKEMHPCLTCRHWGHVRSSTLGFCVSDNPCDKAEGFLYADASARRPCWEGVP